MTLTMNGFRHVSVAVSVAVSLAVSVAVSVAVSIAVSVAVSVAVSEAHMRNELIQRLLLNDHDDGRREARVCCSVC